MKLLALAVVALILSGCTGATLLRDPSSGLSVRCRTTECVDDRLRAGYTCLKGDCWEVAPMTTGAPAGTVYVPRVPGAVVVTPVATPAPRPASTRDCRSAPVSDLRACLGATP